MKQSIIVLALLMASGCAGTKSTPKSKKTQYSQAEMKKLRKECLMEDKALSCATYAYRSYDEKPAESISFYNKACKLGDQNSCFTVKSIKQKAISKNLAIFERKNEMLDQCYITFGPKHEGALNMVHSSSENNYIDVRVSVNINPDGSVQGTTTSVKDIKKLDRRLNLCMLEVAKLAEFIPSDEYQRITLKIKMFRQFQKEKPSAFGKAFAKILESLKTLD